MDISQADISLSLFTYQHFLPCKIGVLSINSQLYCISLNCPFSLLPECFFSLLLVLIMSECVLPNFYPQYLQPENICLFITLPLSHHFTKVYVYFSSLINSSRPPIFCCSFLKSLQTLVLKDSRGKFIYFFL